MELEKQTYLNTENLGELYERKSQVFASYRAGQSYGGIRFTLKRRALVTITVECVNPGAAMLLVFDDRLLTKTRAPRTRFELRVDRGEHFLEAVAPYSHDGFVLTAESVGLEKGRLYSDRVGGYSEGTTNRVFLLHGDRILEKVTASNGAVSSEMIGGFLQDGAMYYDKDNALYTSDKATLSASAATALTVNTGVSATLATSGLKYAAICDGRTLPAGVDYLVAYVASGALYIGAAAANRAIASTDFADPISGIVRVTSAQNGSVLMTQNAEGIWKGLYFHPSGDASLLCGSISIPYYEIPLTRNRLVAPNAQIEGSASRPAFYYRTEDGVLMRLLYGGSPTRKCYLQAFFPTTGNGLSLQDGEVQVAVI